MERKSTPRCCSLWAARRWRLVLSHKGQYELSLHDQCFNHHLSASSTQCLLPSTTEKATKLDPASCCSPVPALLSWRRAKSSSASTTKLWKVRGQQPHVCSLWTFIVLILLKHQLSYLCRYLRQLSQRRPVCSARAEWRQQTEGETLNWPHHMLCSCIKVCFDCVCLMFSSQGDVILQSDHVIETLTKVMICADKINSVNINQGRWETAVTLF